MLFNFILQIDSSPKRIYRNNHLIVEIIIYKLIQCRTKFR